MILTHKINTLIDLPDIRNQDPEDPELINSSKILPNLNIKLLTEYIRSSKFADSS